MQKLKIWFTDFWPEWNNEDFITPILKKYYDVVVTNQKPDVVFHSIFGKEKKVGSFNCKKVLYLGENWRPKQFGSHYSISFDPTEGTNFRLPLWQVYLLLKPELKERLYNRRREENFERFCSFTVSNSNNFLRNGFYHQLSGYKPVHSYGRYIPNDPALAKLSQGKYWRDAKDEFFKLHTHKYSIAFENTSYPGYTTEKLMDAFLAGSLPIYNGDPRVAREFNPNAFIYPFKGSSLDNCFAMVKETDQNEDLFRTMYNEPVFTPEQKQDLEANLAYFEKWLVDIVNK